MNVEQNILVFFVDFGIFPWLPVITTQQLVNGIIIPQVFPTKSTMIYGW